MLQPKMEGPALRRFLDSASVREEMSSSTVSGCRRTSGSRERSMGKGSAESRKVENRANERGKLRMAKEMVPVKDRIK